MNFFLEIDYFSGRPNPKIALRQEDFAACCEKIYALETTEPRALFDGLGFRGFILSGPGTTLHIQKNIIKIQANDIQFRKNNPGIITGLFELIYEYDRNKEYEMIVMAIKEYLA